jgi:glycopeptide antibiotics resistance protein
MRKGIEIVESMNNKVKGSDKRKMKKVISMGMIGIIISAMLLASMASPALANESSATSAYTPRAFVYGDANEDATVDMRDVTYIKLVLFKKKPETKWTYWHHNVYIR